MATITLQRAEFGLADLKSRYEQGRGRLELLQSQHDARVVDLDKVRDDIELWRQVQALFSKTTEYARRQLVARIESTVTAALQAVFGEGISFRVLLKEIGGRPAAEWQVETLYGDMIIAGDPEDANGGGVVDVISLALRLALLELSRPKPSGPVLLDEVGKHVSAEYAPNVAYFLKEYARKTGRQIILVTHQTALAEVADKSYRVAKVDGRSEVAEA